jgi:hypothetical protein
MIGKSCLLRSAAWWLLWWLRRLKSAGAFLLPLLCLTTTWMVDFLTKGGVAGPQMAPQPCHVWICRAEAYQQLGQGKVEGQSSDDEKHEDLNSLYYAWSSEPYMAVPWRDEWRTIARRFLQSALSLSLLRWSTLFQQLVLRFSAGFADVSLSETMQNMQRAETSRLLYKGGLHWTPEFWSFCSLVILCHFTDKVVIFAVGLWMYLVPQPGMVRPAIGTLLFATGATWLYELKSECRWFGSEPAAKRWLWNFKTWSRGWLLSKRSCEVFLLMNSDLIVTYFRLHEQAATFGIVFEYS